jgi:bla regulator protein BlaR1
MNRRQVLMAAGALVLKGQNAEFEVASIKPSDPKGRGMRLQMDRGRMTGSGLTVKFLIQTAYDVRGFQIQGGPGWIDSERYDIIAKGDEKNEDLGPMVQALLADRFKMVLHRETKELPVYALVVAKGGSKMTLNTSPADDPEKGTRMSVSRGRFEFRKGEMAELTVRLSQQLGRKVIDRTELTGGYDFKLEWTPDEAQPGMMKEPGTIQIEGGGPSIFTALQEQLGLKLESTKGPVEILAIDRVERPSEN